MASGSGGGGAASNPPAPAPAAAPAAAPCAGACESCHSAPGIPFCRVDWSLLCPGCAAVVHANQWIIAVPPNPAPTNPTPAPVVDLSSDSAAGGARRRRGKAKAVMRYREKRKSRRFEKTVRYEGRKVYAEQRPRVDGKFVAEGVPVDGGDVGGVAAGYFEAMPGAGEAAGMDVRGDEEGELGLGLDLGLFDVGEELRLL